MNLTPTKYMATVLVRVRMEGEPSLRRGPFPSNAFRLLRVYVGPGDGDLGPASLVNLVPAQIG